jgi:triacylglycerol esterase/lipase EstA (alpha/beta hydrolase family)
VELFWQIKGGRVDYGAKHAERHGHARFGRTFPGLYPRWDAAHPVHLIGHSMGGQTARMLVQMLRDQVPRPATALRAVRWGSFDAASGRRVMAGPPAREPAFRRDRSFHRIVAYPTAS